MTEVKSLNQRLLEELGRGPIQRVQLPREITENLNPKFPLRPYQEWGFRLLLSYWHERFDGKPKAYHQLLFHMATGSGKTLMMAGSMLYLYEQGYRRFLFFVNNNNIIDKTRDNFLSSISSKYLFAPTVSFADKRVRVAEVANFQAAGPDDLSVAFTTIQGLHARLNDPRENDLTYDDFESQRIVLISDEAHHINVDTKRGQQRALGTGLESGTWETTVERIAKAHPANVLLEFTATMDLADPNLAAKYRPRLLFDYPLRDFRRDGYSKEVRVLQADLEPFDRSLQAVLLSQYRRKLFEKHGHHIKPVLLIKSKTIKESQDFQKVFAAGMRGVSGGVLGEIRKKATDAAIQRMFAYYDANAITLENLATEIQEDFSEDKLLSVNSKDESEAKQLAVNSLEDSDNEFRVVFAVDKLNEGWDVLNLFDIVRVYDTRDSKAGTVGKTTMSEAQLIGRGARYCPFRLSDDQPLYSRKFDTDLENELRICEELYYHSAYNPRYVQELNIALQEIGVRPKETKECKVTLKRGFMASEVYKTGHLYVNERKKYQREDVVGLDPVLIARRHQVALQTGYTSSTVVFDDASTDKSAAARHAKDYQLRDFGVPVIRKAMQRIVFFEFASLRSHLPNLKSVNEFITSEMYAGKIAVEVSGNRERIENLDQDDKVDIASVVLARIAEAIASNTVEYKGSKVFKPRAVRETFGDRTLNVTRDDGDDKQIGRPMSDPANAEYHLDLASKEWYVFNDCFGTSEEKLLVKYVDKRYEELKRKYSDAYLIRNDRAFRLYNFADGRAFEPDFLLYLVGKDGNNTMHYQVFIEPKGGHLLKADEWKERFLVELRATAIVERLFANRSIVLWGLPFYNQDERGAEFTKAFDELIAL